MRNSVSTKDGGEDKNSRTPYPGTTRKGPSSWSGYPKERNNPGKTNWGKQTEGGGERRENGPKKKKMK